MRGYLVATVFAIPVLSSSFGDQRVTGRLIVATVCMLVLISVTIRGAYEAEAVAVLKQLGGTILYIDNDPRKPVCQVSLPGNNVTDGDLKLVAKLPNLQSFKLQAATKITNYGLENLAGLEQLTDLVLGGTQITDGGLSHLARLTRLKNLSLSLDKVTPEGLRKLQEALPNCKIMT
jgi:hypothetical protein